MESLEVIPLDPRFEALCEDCWLVFPRASGCNECDERREVEDRHAKPAEVLQFPLPFAA